jgi:outer membrane receptor protein involved in Fe transport
MNLPPTSRSRSPIALLVAVMTFIVLLTASLQLRADDVADEADHLFTLGAEHYQQKDFKGALQYFLASNRLVRNRNVMFNIARCYENLHEPADAYRYYQRALEGETDNGTKQRVKEAMQRLGPSVALLKVETDPPGATLYLNRKDLGDRGTSPQTIALSAGSYTVIAELQGYEDATSQRVDIRLGGEKTVSLKLTRVVGTLRVVGAAGADVRIDADDAPVLCQAPCDPQVPPGQHVLILTKPGFRPTRQNVQIRANQTTEVKPDIEAETGQLVVNADEREAIIEVDGKTQGFTPAVLTVPVGKHLLHVGLRGFRPVEREVEIKANEQTQVDLQLFTAESVEAASRAEESIEDAPASVSLITSPELRAMRYPTVAEAVRGLRGTYTSDDTAYKAVGFRGFNRPGDYGNRVLVLVDGQPANDNWLWSSYVGYDLRTDLEDVERIEVVRGPGSVLYGTGAFSGVINLVSHARDTPDGREVGVSVAGDGVARGRIRYTKHFAKDAGVTTSVAAGHGEGRDFFFPEFASVGPPAAAGYARGLDGFRVATWTGKLFYKAFQAQWSFNYHDKDLPIAQYDTIFADGRNHQIDSRGFLELKFEPKITDSLTSVTRVHGNVYVYRGEFPHVPDVGGLEHSDFDGMWVGAEQRFVFTPNRFLRLTGGGEFQLHPIVHQKGSDEQSGQFFDDKHPFNLAAGYVLADVTPSKRVKLELGGRVDAYSFTSPSINPRLALILKPYDGGNVKIMAGKAFRAPSIYERYNTASGGQTPNADLKPENLYSAEIEYSHRFTPTVVGTAATYANYITELIALRELPGSTQAEPRYSYQNNTTPVATLGGELELRREWKEGWMVSAQYSFQKSRFIASDSLGDAFAFKKNSSLREVANSPSHLAYVKGAVPLFSRALMLMTRLGVEGPRFDRNDTAGSPPQTNTRAALLWDMVLSGSETRWGLQYAIGVYNLFDARWRVPVSTEITPISIPQSGRTLLALASVTF